MCFGSINRHRSNDRSRPQTTLNINIALKQIVKPSRINPLPHGVFQKLPKLEPTCRILRVELLSFLLRRISTVGLPKNLERSRTLSLKVLKNPASVSLLPLSHIFLFLFDVRDDTMHNFVLLSFKTISIMSSMSLSLDFLHLALARPKISIISLLM